MFRNECMANIFVDNSINGFASFWHGNYENRQYVFSKSDISNLSRFCRGNIFSKVDISNIADDILPGVELIGNMAKVGAVIGMIGKD